MQLTILEKGSHLQASAAHGDHSVARDHMPLPTDLRISSESISEPSSVWSSGH